MTFEFIQNDTNDRIQLFRSQLYTELVAPLDGMWQDLHIAFSSTYLIRLNGAEIGYACVDEQKSLLQIYHIDSYKYVMSVCIDELIRQEIATSAKLSSIEPVSFNVCLDRSKTIQKDTINYCYSSSQATFISEKLQFSYRLATVHDLSSIKLFLKEEIGFDDQFGYTENVIERKESFIFENNHEIIALGECRLSDTQLKYADLGMMVRENQRGQGLGSYVFSKMVNEAHTRKRVPICSTTVENIASQKAIQKAGFYTSYIIFEMSF